MANLLGFAIVIAVSFSLFGPLAVIAIPFVVAALIHANE